MKRVVTFGEIMLRLATPDHGRFVQSDSFEVTYGGGEANVAASLARFGHDAALLTALPEHDLGEAAVDHLRRFGVDTSLVVRGGGRLGLYFLESGASQRGSKVIYDRAGSAVSELTPEAIERWAQRPLGSLFEGVDWFHFTGITPALGETPRRTLRALLEAARAASTRVSVDLNFRKKLWTEDAARAEMTSLMPLVDVCIANEEDADKCLGMPAERTDVDRGELDEAAYADLARRLRARFGFEAVAITLRESMSASRNGWSAMLHDGGACVEPRRSTRYEIDIVDRVGAGDSFAAGLIHGLLELPDSAEALEFAAAASCLKHTIRGDFNLVSVAEVDGLRRGGGAGRVER